MEEFYQLVDIQSKNNYFAFTGTNGKTSTAYLTHQMLVKSGYESIYIGTLGTKYNNEEINNSIPLPPIIKSIIRRNWADEESDSSDDDEDDAADKDIAMKIEKERLNGWVSLETNSNNLNLTDKNINMNKPKVEEYKFTYRPRLEGKRIIKNWADEETDDSSDDDEEEHEEQKKQGKQEWKEEPFWTEIEEMSAW